MTIPQGIAGFAGTTRLPRLVVAGLGLALLSAGCATEPSSAPSPSPSASEGVVRIASYDFSENLILAEIYTQALRQAGIPVELVPNLGTREVIQPALEQGQIDFVVDYLGSALEAVDASNPAAHSSLGHARAELQRVMADRGVTVLAAADAQDQNGFAVTRRTAQTLSSPTISALSPTASSMVLGAPPECADRPYCLQGLESLYGLNFARLDVIDTRAATATALQTGEIDVGLLETTDARLADGRFVLLKDDMGLQPRENVIPLVRQPIVDEYGTKLTDAVAAVTSRLTTAVLVELNRRVEVDGRTPAEVASEWLSN
ncbi:MAG TPA: ABC transporter substrate-binding protein [Actinomycetes bacterium]|nr:ABC transporter substrate-binding protein [Actinomycetes bacterium]